MGPFRHLPLIPQNEQNGKTKVTVYKLKHVGGPVCCLKLWHGALPCDLGATRHMQSSPP